MIHATHCPDCGRELFYPDEWARMSVECPQCRAVVPLQPGPASAESGNRRWAGVTRMTCLFLLVAGVLFAVSKDETDDGLENPPVKVRCLLCETSFELSKSEWEARVFAARPLLAKRKRPIFRLPETTPVECPKCHLKSAYLFDRTVPCTRCGKLRLKVDPSLGSEFAQLRECPNCVKQAAAHRTP